MTWTFENTGFHSGVFNMQYDEQLAREVASGERLPTVRVYGWNPPAISYGWNQSLDEIDIESARQAGVHVVRRPTGGRAILHSQELTYSVVMPAAENSVSGVYKTISEALVCGLRHIGILASLEKSQPDFPSLYRSASATACFSSSARHEIKVNGRKLVGSAQRRFHIEGQEVILQHGSLLLAKDHLRIVDFLKLSTEFQRDSLRKELSNKTTEVNSLLGSRVEYEEVAQAIRRGFEEQWNVVFESHTQQAAQAALS
jgi:lipoate-protein ligase A